MESWQWALVIKPLVLPIFIFGVVAPVAWVLFELFPNGRLKVMLFRDRSGPEATRRDKVVMVVAWIGAYAALIVAGVIAFG